MSEIIFEHTKFSKYAAQGESPSGAEGCNIWIRDHENNMEHFLGWCPMDRVVDEINYYRENGNTLLFTSELEE